MSSVMMLNRTQELHWSPLEDVLESAHCFENWELSKILFPVPGNPIAKEVKLFQPIGVSQHISDKNDKIKMVNIAIPNEVTDLGYDHHGC